MSTSSIPVIINTDSGYFLNGGDVDSLTDGMKGVFESAQCEMHAIRTDAAGVEKAIQSVTTSPSPVVFIMGGDGTVRSAMHLLRSTGKSLAILPGGTMNVYAREQGISDDPLKAASQLLAGHDRPVDLADLNGIIFFGSAVLGAVPGVARVREQERGRDFFRQSHALMAASWRALNDGPPLKLECAADGRRFHFKSKAVVVGNNEIVPEPGMPLFRAGWDSGLLFIYIYRLRAPWQLAVFGILFILGLWKRADRLTQVQCREAVFYPRRNKGPAKLDVMLDGEPITFSFPLRFTIHPAAISIRVPQNPENPTPST